VLQHTGEVRDDEDKGAHDKTEQHDVLGHCRAVFVLAQPVEELPNFRQNTIPQDTTSLPFVYGQLCPLLCCRWVELPKRRTSTVARPRCLAIVRKLPSILGAQPTSR
jgi:hypothetical protein